jgi:uncharacterized protein
MAQRAGSANLPLHGGQVPRWLADRMTRLGAVISEAIVHHYGRDELLRRLAHPFWFQSFGAVMGMDWHSSGITTSVIGALKRGLAPLEQELGIYVCGGRGKYSRQTPHELVEIGDKVGFDGATLATASRLVAKVDSAAVQDGFQLYLHGFIVTDDGHWTVVQQGMNGELKQARRYHWLSEGLESFVDEPHAAIEGPGQGNVDARRLYGNLAAAADRGPTDFTDLLLTPGVGARTVRALAMVAEIVHGAPYCFADPARFSFAHGGKDRHPFPVPIRVYDETIRVLKSAVSNARLGRDEELGALKRLDAQARLLEHHASGPPVEELIAEERARSHSYGGRSVFGWARGNHGTE